MFQAAGAQVSTILSNEVYIGMQTGALDAAVTSSTSLISFRLEELSKNLTASRGRTFWFMLEPLLISKEIFESLPADQQKTILEVGLEMEDWGTKEARKDDEEVAKVYAAKGVQIVDLGPDDLAKWRAVSEQSAWKDFGDKNSSAAELLKLAKAIS